MPKVVALLTILLTQISCFVKGQQNSTLFFMRSTPQANFVNPAVRNTCEWLIGLPVISSVHVQYGNPSFSVVDFFQRQPDNTVVFGGDALMNRLGRTNYINTELHTNLLFLGHLQGDNYYTFSVSEKADLFATYSHDLLAFATQGNSQFEGKHADLSRIGVFLNYRREYAFGLAKPVSKKLTLGIRIKLLFGKLNTSIPQSNIDLYTAPNTNAFDLTFNDNWRVNTSLPIQVGLNANNTIQDIAFNGSLNSILMNRSNLGLALDLGFINYQNEDMTVSGSILDVGFIRWANGYEFTQNGQYSYYGPLGSSSQQDSYIDNLVRVLQNDFGITASPKSYMTFLIPTYYIGATYKLKNDLNAGAVLSGKINSYRITSGVTLSLNKDFNQKAGVSLSWSYLYKSFANIGAGVKVGKSPIQFYAVTDNILGLIKPLDTKNINLRFGMQFNFGCNKRENLNNCGCTGIRPDPKRNLREEKVRKQRKRQS